MKGLCIFVLFFFVHALNASAATVSVPPKIKTNPRIGLAGRLIAEKDYLGFRIQVKKLYQESIRKSEWEVIKKLISTNAERVGLDLVPLWNLRNPAVTTAPDKDLAQADELMMKTRFEEAFVLAQNAAKSLKAIAKKDEEAKALLPYAYHAMGRALYGARRYDDAVKVYQWINTSYPGIRQALFEKMWAAFKAGRVEVALGAIASQRSSYFSNYLPSEAYLIQTYLLKRLCREDDLHQVTDELKKYQSLIENGKLEDWVQTDPSASTLWRLTRAEIPLKAQPSLVSQKDRDAEKKAILAILQRRYERIKPVLLKNLQIIQAFEHLAKITDTKTILKPIEVMKDRDHLLKMDLEIWPADSAEEWLDEVGKHVLIGDSLCKQEK
jgi:tetratricopeptide (TPR) repeat protein